MYTYGCIARFICLHIASVAPADLLCGEPQTMITASGEADAQVDDDKAEEVAQIRGAVVFTHCFLSAVADYKDAAQHIAQSDMCAAYLQEVPYCAGFPVFQGWLDGKCIWIIHVTDVMTQPSALRLMARQAAACAANHAAIGRRQVRRAAADIVVWTTLTMCLITTACAWCDIVPLAKH